MLTPSSRQVCGVIVVMAASVASAHAQTAVTAFDIPAQALGTALNQWARQAGMRLSFSPGIVAGKHSPGLQATLPALDALGKLLEHTGLTMRHGAPGTVFVYAQGTQLPVAHLAPIQIWAEPPGTYTYSSEQIRDTPASNRDLSNLIATHPAVRLGNSANNGSNRGSMAVEDVAFHGASPYQNLFQIDGMDASSNVDPANKNLNMQIGNVPSNPQAYFVDTSLLEDVKVLDSFVPAEYGHFNGGVVDARLRQASGENSLRLSYRFNSSNLTYQRVGEAFQDDFEDGEIGYSKDWRKHFISAVGDYTFNDRLGMVLNVSRRESRIDRTRTRIRPGGQRDRHVGRMDDRIDNVLAKFNLNASSDTTSHLTLKYAQRTEELVNGTWLWEYNHQAYGAAWSLVHKLPRASYSLTTGYDHFLNDRDSNSNAMITYAYDVDRRLQHTSGGYSREETARDTWSIKNRLDFDPVTTGPVSHSVYAGLDVQHIDARFKRHADSYSYYLRHLPDGTTRERSKSLYHRGRVPVGYDTYALYLSDQMSWRDWALTGSVRYDKETFIGNSNFSPRLRLDWDVLGRGSTQLSTGWSRYYGDNILYLGLREQIRALRESLIDGRFNPVTNGRYDPDYTRYKSLRTPYHDEWAFQLIQRVAGIEARAGFVRRNGRDQVAVTGTGNIANPYVYNNSGRSQSRTWSLMLHNLEPWRGMGALWRLHASVSHMRLRSNSDAVAGYRESLDDDDIYVIYNGKRMLLVDRPVVAFNRPSQASMRLATNWPSVGVTLNNTLSWKSARDDIAYVGPGPAPERLSRYESVRVPSYWTWDASVIWQPHFMKGLTLSVEALNVTNNYPVIVPTAPNRTGNRHVYHVGREIWLQAAYQF